MNIKNTKAFTLVELLVVITILAIISVVAYQNFGGAVDKANSGRKISDVSTIETSLQQYKADKNFYPPVDAQSNTNLWGHTTSNANPSNVIKIVPSGQEIQSIIVSDTKGGGKIMANGGAIQIGAKGTISRETLGKKYLSKDLYDPELGDVKIKDIDSATAGDQAGKMIDLGIGRYIYAIYKKGSNNTRGNDYNIAYTIKKEGTDKYVTKIVGSYDKESCYGDPTDCPDTLLGQYNNFLKDGEQQKLNAGVIDTTMPNQGIPYALSDFKE